MNLQQVIEQLRSDPDFVQNVTHWRTLPARPAQWVDLPDSLHPAGLVWPSDHTAVSMDVSCATTST